MIVIGNAKNFSIGLTTVLTTASNRTAAKPLPRDSTMKESVIFVRRKKAKPVIKTL